jgi:hypothetical protein
LKWVNKKQIATEKRVERVKEKQKRVKVTKRLNS